MQRAFGTHDLWDAVRSLARRYLRTQPVIESRVERAKAGFAVLTWLASVAAPLAGGATPVLAPGDPVHVNAMTWLQSSLDLSEKLGGAAGSWHACRCPRPSAAARGAPRGAKSAVRDAWVPLARGG